MIGAVYAPLAVGFSLVFVVAKIINPAHTAFFMLAADAVYVLVIITVCNKVSRTSADLVSHMMGRRDTVHQDWINPTGFNYAEVFASQFRILRQRRV